MLDGSGNNNLLNVQIGARSAERQKTTVNKYYNALSQKMEEIVLPSIDLEFNTAVNPEKTTFSRFT